MGARTARKVLRPLYGKRVMSLVGLGLLLLAGCGDGQGDAADSKAPEIVVRNATSSHVIPVGDPRHGQLLAELDSLFTIAYPAPTELGRRELALSAERGALEFRFRAARSYTVAVGEDLRPWRVLIPLGVEPAPSVGESGALLLLGYPDYGPRPLISPRGRQGLIKILESS